MSKTRNHILKVPYGSNCKEAMKTALRDITTDKDFTINYIAIEKKVLQLASLELVIIQI